jgi:drug/metabolite transporter (DMT)-like permease
MASGSLVFAAMMLISREMPVLPVRTDTWLAQIYLIVIGSCVVFGMMLFVLKRWSASATAYGMVVMPFVTIAASSWLTGETITPVFAVGAALVLLGVYVGALSRSAIASRSALTKGIAVDD